MRPVHAATVFVAGLLCIPAASEAAVYTLNLSSWGQVGGFTVTEYTPPAHTNATQVLVGNGYMGVLKFNLNSVTLPDDEVVVSATLNYRHPYVQRNPAAAPIVTGGRLTLDALSIPLADTANRNLIFGVAEGGTFSSPKFLNSASAADLTPATASVYYGTTNGYWGAQTLNVTSAVASWLEDDATNYGLGITSTQYFEMGPAHFSLRLAHDYRHNRGREHSRARQPGLDASTRHRGTFAPSPELEKRPAEPPEFNECRNRPAAMQRVCCGIGRPIAALLPLMKTVLGKPPTHP